MVYLSEQPDLIQPAQRVLVTAQSKAPTSTTRPLHGLRSLSDKDTHESYAWNGRDGGCGRRESDCEPDRRLAWAGSAGCGARCKVLADGRSALLQ